MKLRCSAASCAALLVHGVVAAVQAQTACSAPLNLEQIYRGAGMRPLMSYKDMMQAARGIEGRHDLRFRVVYRPPGKDEPESHLMAANPHLHSQVLVCPGQVIDLYVARRPMRLMPDQPLQGLTLAEAQTRLRGLAAPYTLSISPDGQHAQLGLGGQGAASPAARVIGQWPPPGQPLFETYSPAGTASSAQGPLLVLAAHDEPEACPPQRPPTPAHEPLDPGTLAAGAAGLGAGAGALAMRLAQRRSQPQGPNPQPAGPSGAALPPTRVRPDLDGDELDDADAGSPRGG